MKALMIPIRRGSPFPPPLHRGHPNTDQMSSCLGGTAFFSRLASDNPLSTKALEGVFAFKESVVLGCFLSCHQQQIVLPTECQKVLKSDKCYSVYCPPHLAHTCHLNRYHWATSPAVFISWDGHMMLPRPALDFQAHIVFLPSGSHCLLARVSWVAGTTRRNYLPHPDCLHARPLPLSCTPSPTAL